MTRVGRRARSGCWRFGFIAAALFELSGCSSRSDAPPDASSSSGGGLDAGRAEIAGELDGMADLPATTPDGGHSDGSSEGAAPDTNASCSVQDGPPVSAGPSKWMALSRVGAPTAREGMASVWTGTEMLIWGGAYHGPDGWDTSPLPGMAYSPAEDRWRTLPSPTFSLNRRKPVAVFTGEEMIIWDSNLLTPGAAWGARYNPKTDVWREVSKQGAPRAGSVALWTGKVMVVWGATDGGDLAPATGIYDPQTDRWSPVDPTGGPPVQTGARGIWTGQEVIVLGGEQPDSNLPAASGRLNVESRKWSPLSKVNAPSPRAYHSMVWTGTEVIVWGGYARVGNVTSAAKDAARYRPSTDEWAPISLAGAPRSRWYQTGVWTGRQMLIWDGSAPGGLYDPCTDRWSPLSAEGEPIGRYFHAEVWTGSELIVWGGSGSVPGLASYSVADGARLRL